MANISGKEKRSSIKKRTSQGGKQPKRASMNKTKKSSFKAYRKQGR